MKKIVNIYNGYIASSDQGGGIKYVENLISLQKKYFNKIYLLSLGSGKKKILNISGTTVHFYPISKSHNWITFAIKLFLFLKKNKKKFINCNFHIHRLYFAPFIKAVKARKIIATIHTKTFEVFKHNFPYLKILVYFFIKIERIIIKYCVDELSFAGIFSKNLYKSRHNKLNKKLWYLPPAFDFKKSSNSSFFSGEKKKIILVVGRLSVGKRPFSALRLFEKAIQEDKYIRNNFKLCFVGHGELYNEINDYIKNKKLNKFILPIKKIQSTLMPSVYNSCYAVLFVSESEVNPFIIKEALVSGKPIFTTNVGTAQKLVSKKNGIIIPTKNPSQNVNKFIKFLKKNYKSKKVIQTSKEFILKDEKILSTNIKKIYE
ncbi:glycosyltransferase [Candidatus Pelagibacter sp. Uisw_130]|uniref:glycosyltransferase n=1 Tax=Candidatus Pelagibacter sp. Uisw_130 TaxID=3230989 RepID=UPI0039E742DF